MVADSMDESCGCGHGPHTREGLRRAKPAVAYLALSLTDRMHTGRNLMSRIWRAHTSPIPSPSAKRPRQVLSLMCAREWPGAQPAGPFLADPFRLRLLNPNQEGEWVYCAAARDRRSDSRPPAGPSAVHGMPRRMPMTSLEMVQQPRLLRLSPAFEIGQEMGNVHLQVPLNRTKQTGIQVLFPVVRPISQVIFEQGPFPFGRLYVPHLEIPPYPYPHPGSG